MKTFALGSLTAMCLTLPLAADPIIYTMTGTLSGSLGGAALTDAPFTFVFDGDTAGIFPVSTTLLLNSATSTSIFITGFGSGQFTEAVLVGVSTPSAPILSADLAGFS